MAEYTTNEYKNEKRRQARSLIREGMFISDFVETKYNSIYQEAAALYNEINQINPRKPDLRRTSEYRQWKNNIASEHNMPLIPMPRQKKRQLVHVTHRNIPVSTTTSHPHNICIVLPVVESPPSDNQIPPQPESPRAEIPLASDNQIPPQPESPRAEISLSDNQTSPQSESPRAEISLSDNQTSPQSSENPAPDSRISGKIMQLKIPLIQSPSIPKTIQDPKGILGTACEETMLDEGNQSEMFNPSLLDEVPPEAIEKIISDLQQDPNLKDMMADIENQMNIEEEIVGLNIDIPDLYDPLEEELRNIFW